MSAANLELPQVKSSKELLRKKQIKREKMTSKECTIAPSIAAQRQVYLPNLNVSDKTNLDRRLNSTKQNVAVAGTIQHKIHSQNKLRLEELTSKSIRHRQLQEPNRKLMKKAAIANDKSKERLQAPERAFTQLINSSANEQLK